MQKIVIEIDEFGDAKVEGFGFVGAECKKLTAAIETALGVVEKTELKAEYRHASSANAARNKVQR